MTERLIRLVLGPIISLVYLAIAAVALSPFWAPPVIVGMAIYWIFV